MPPSSSSQREEVPRRSQLQVPLMDDRVPLGRRYVQLGPRLLDKRSLPRSEDPRLRMTQCVRIASLIWVSYRVEPSLLPNSSPSSRRAPNLRLGA